jgi:murein DD-endopeptidase MepM/ murein hydrolase activator NlpD
LLLVRRDGSAFVELGLARLIAAGCIVLLVTVAGLTRLAAHRTNTGAAAISTSRADDDAVQRRLMGAFRERIAELGHEVAAWREIHARILEPFGPAGLLDRRRTGVGGAVAAAPSRASIPAAADDLEALTENVREAGESLRVLDRLITRAATALAALPSTWPVRGFVNSEFGTRVSPWSGASEFHSGLDIAAERGTPVTAPAAGQIAFAGYHPEYGLMIVIDHGREIRTVYAHLARLRVRQGQHVERGATIGLTGTTGRSSGPHLHYEILVSGEPVNPRAYLWD